MDFGGSGSGHSFTATGITRGFSSVIALGSEWINCQTQEIDPEQLGEMFCNFVPVSYTHLIEKSVRLELTYDEIDNSIDNIWSVLFTTGYLTQVGMTEQGAYKLVIPNKEVRELYKLQIQDWFDKKLRDNTEQLTGFWNSIEEGKTEAIEQYLNLSLIHICVFLYWFILRVMLVDQIQQILYWRIILWFRFLNVVF